MKRQCNYCKRNLDTSTAMEAFNEWYCNWACYQKYKLESYYDKKKGRAK